MLRHDIVAPGSPAMPHARDELRRIRQQIDERLAELIPESVDPLQQIVRAAVLGKGKRARSTLAVLVADALAKRGNAAVDPACAIEMIHVASLIVDDLPCMDAAAWRRDLPAVHVHYGEDAAILSAIVLVSLAFATIGAAFRHDPDLGLQLVGLLARALDTRGLPGGQFRDLRSGCTNASVEELAAINSSKTGALFEVAVRTGACIAEVHDARAWHLVEFASELGQAYQLQNDLIEPEEPHVHEPSARTPHPRTLVSACGHQDASLRYRQHVANAFVHARRGPCSSALSSYLAHLFPDPPSDAAPG